MKLGKRQLVLATLILALGAAVYLNWEFSGDRALMANTEASESSQLGAAQLVNNAYVETVTDPLGIEGSTEAAAQESAQRFSEVRLSRQTSRDEAVALLEDVLSNMDADSEAREQAVTQASAIAQNILKETNVEGLLKAKGYEESVAYINNGECSIVVSGEIEESDTLIIQEIVLEQTGLSADKIKIIGIS